MKRQTLTSIIFLLFTTMNSEAQTYSSLWRRAETAQQKDLPKDEAAVLRTIAGKAAAEKAYGHLLKAQLREATVWTEVSPDSLGPQVKRIEEQESKAKDRCLKAVYQTVLGYIYLNNSQLSDSAEATGKHYYEQAMQYPELLAKTSAGLYEPLVVEGADSKYFDNDLLSLIGRQTQRFDLMHTYYEKAGNSRATLLSALEMLRQQRPQRQERLNQSAYIRQLDSLATRYEQLTEAGEVAIERYQYMESQTDATTEQKVQYINLALNRWGGWKRMNILRQSYQDLTTMRFHVSMGEQPLLPDRPIVFNVNNMCSVNTLTLQVWKVNVDGTTTLNPTNANDYRQLKSLMSPLKQLTQTRHYVGKQPWQVYVDSVTLPGLPVGVYLLEFLSEPQAQTFTRQLLFVTGLTTLRHALPDGSIRFAVVDSHSGQPVKGAHLELTTGSQRSKRNIIATLTTDDNGEAVYKRSTKDRSYMEVRAYTDDDRAQQPSNAYASIYTPKKQTGTEHVHLFTDRAIYRPGQQVHVAAVAYRNTDGVNNDACVRKAMTMQLRDANWQVVGEQQAETDDMGTCSVTFTLPQTTLSGHFTIQTANGSVSIRVEEYKRPTFEVELPEVTQRYEAGDTIVVSGKARTYSGVPVSSARVTYTVTRRPALWWWWHTGGAAEELYSAEATTDGNGQFQIELPLQLPEEALDADGNMSKRALFYNFVANVQVTDAAGESHTAQLSVPLGTRKTAFSCDVPTQVLATELNDITFHLHNAAGQEVKADVTWQIDGGTLQQGHTQESVKMQQPLSSGRHEITAYCEQDTLHQQFVVFSLDDRQPATETHDWFYLQAGQWPSADDDLTLQVGSSDEDLYILFNIVSGDRLLESGRERLSNALLNRKFRYDESYGDGLLVTYAWVKDGRVYHHEAQLRRPEPDRRLRLSWKTFRDRLTPGQQETWTLSIQPVAPSGTNPQDAGQQSSALAAQLMATLYDKSLDQIVKHQWSFIPYQSLLLPSSTWAYSAVAKPSFYGQKTQKALSWTELQYSHIDESVIPHAYQYRYGLRHRQMLTMMRKSATPSAVGYAADEVLTVNELAVEAKAVVGNAAAMSDGLTEAAEEEQSFREDAGTGETDATQVPMRENLQETAFFFPQLQADSTGQVTLSFQLPESLTTWRFMGLAHSADLHFGQIEGETVAQKELMITPNVPRFVRQGDEATLQARVSNMTERTQNAKALMQLIDPETQKVVARERHDVTIKGDTTVSVTFHINIKDGHELLIVRTSIEADNVSDGEQHYLPVLPQQERVTATLPFLLDQPGTHTIDISSILPAKPKGKKGDSSRQIVSSLLEYTASPAWLVVQALPSMAAPQNDNVICNATSLYANMLGRGIAQSVPGLKQAIDLWQRETGDEQTLTSQLEKNQQLRDIVLNETPWVADAKNETEQRQHLSDFFDANTMNARMTTAVDRLERLQLSDGAWSWWRGMSGSYWMTTEVCKMLARLQHSGYAKAVGNEQNADTQQQLMARMSDMQQKATGYLAKETVELVERMKAEERKGHKQVFPGLTALEWLYICAIDGEQDLSRQVKEANQYLVTLLKKEIKNQSIYEKALTAIVLQQAAPQLARQYAESLKQYTVSSKELGRYYDTQRASYSWQDYRIPTQTAAIEALCRITPQDTLTLREMQLWLMHEKRTQAWQTPLVSVNAIHAMLLNGNRPTPGIKDNNAIGAGKATAMVGYQKRPLEESELKKGSVSVKKETTGTSWGAVYAQYWQPLDEVKDQKSGITVKREMTVVKSQAEKERSKQKDGKNGQLHVGDRLRVRITITAQRDMDFVEVTDRRAACMEPVQQLSGYHNGTYRVQRDCSTCYYYDRMTKGKHILETDYYIDRAGTYQLGSCTVQCAYAPEFKGSAKPITITIQDTTE